jgi:hypothetical protein
MINDFMLMVFVWILFFFNVECVFGLRQIYGRMGSFDPCIKIFDKFNPKK